MSFTNPKSLKELESDFFFDILIKGINDEFHANKLKELFKETTDRHYLFEDKVFKKTFKTEEEGMPHNMLEYILPTVRRVYYKFYIDFPGILKGSTHYHKQDHRLELFQLQFNLEEFLKKLSSSFKKNRNILKDFEYLDSKTEILTLIVENYVAEKLQYVLDTSHNQIQTEIRDIKLNNQLGV